MSQFADYCPKDTVPTHLDASCGLMIRAAELHDLAALALIAAEREGTTLTAQLKVFKKLLSQHQKTDQSIILVADFHGKIVGYGKCANYTPPNRVPANNAPKGWYLTGLIVTPKFRRRRVAHQLTQARLQWLAQRTPKAYYFSNVQNIVSIELHRQFGFIEVTRDFSFPGVNFCGGKGILFEVDLT
ncbi:MAG: GNAT family N-acetyltransferase [Verrucomicrobiota bacterium]|jgi:ribosomal protein S18 acetylase RimI-like enzyme